ncbi:MAG: ATP-binding protein [Brevundimonas sp.]
MHSDQISPLKIGDTDFLVASTIERCPKVMMIRELVRNAIEAAEKDASGQGLVEFSAASEADAAKLVIWNNGPGMSAEELYEMCDLASSIGKEKGLDANFGMGAKVASLPSNKHGLRYRSCHAGRVSQVVLGFRDGVYGRLKIPLPEGEAKEILDVTDDAKDSGRDCSNDWTEVVLFGNRPDQDTARDPYDGNPDSDMEWLARYLYHRFYRVPENVRLKMMTGTHRLAQNRFFETIDSRISLNAFQKHEAVDAGEGVVVHYLYDPPYEKASGRNKSFSGALQSASSTCGVIYKDEFYDLKSGKAWTMSAPLFGIPFGARHISIHVELPEDARVRPEGYRQFLRYVEGEQEQVASNHFSDLVAALRPQWLIDIIRSLAPDARSNDNIRDELQKLLDELRVRRSAPKVEVDGSELATSETGVGFTAVKDGAGSNVGSTPRTTHSNISFAPSGAKAAALWEGRERAPEIIPLTSKEEVEEKNLKGRAASYYNTGQLFVNMLYPAVEEMRLRLEDEYASAQDTESMRAHAQQAAENSMILRVGRAAVYALAKQLNHEWDKEAVGFALRPESLSLAADDYFSSLQSARRSMGRVFRPNRDEAEELEVELVA